jgi:hypothetical protein
MGADKQGNESSDDEANVQQQQKQVSYQRRCHVHSQSCFLPNTFTSRHRCKLTHAYYTLHYPQVALPPFSLRPHAPAALQFCAPDVLEQEVVREDAVHTTCGHS